MRRRAQLPTVVLLTALTVAACSPTDPVRLEGLGLREAVLAFVAAQQDGDGSYERPSASAGDDLAAAVLALAAGRREQAEELAAPHAYEVVDLEAGRLALAPRDVPDARGWGLYVVDPEGTELAVEVPHPRADLDTERLGVELVNEVAAQHLLIAGAFRWAGDGADVAREQDAVFSAVHTALAGQGTPAVQLHGYAAESLPGVDVVPSPGAAELVPLVRRIADGAEDAGFVVCRPWRDACGQLEGRRNVQGRASARAGTAFVHLELSRELRRGPGRERVVEVLARALRR